MVDPRLLRLLKLGSPQRMKVKRNHDADRPEYPAPSNAREPRTSIQYTYTLNLSLHARASPSLHVIEDLYPHRF